MKKAAYHGGKPRSLRSQALLRAQIAKEEAIGIKREGDRVSDDEKYESEEAKVEEAPTEKVEVETQSDVVDDDLPEESSHEDE